MKDITEIEAVELNYKVVGEGKDLIILHGLFGSLDNWMSLAKQWSDRYKVWLLDQRNHGKSPHSDKFSYLHMAKDLEHFIDQNKIENPIILGHSMGGKTAMEFAVNFPNKVDKLIVVDIAPVKYNVHHYSILEALNSVDPGSLDSRQEADEQLAKLIPEMGVRQFLLKNLDRNPNGGYQWKFNLGVLEREIVPISEWAISEGKYEKDSLFVKGERSEYILPQHAAEISSKFPNYHLEEIESAGHWVHAEKPKEFYEVVNDFMKD
ncbi:MAG: alpha/beta hydrolase [Flavobacteriales bacterium]|nr:alpha/beta hydrolase [Flavobacteriales bacterium]|tara:strand:- start:1083 stop:1874 length:792 start_codon:yes stop_codon:yes gene_type:complete